MKKIIVATILFISITACSATSPTPPVAQTETQLPGSPIVNKVTPSIPDIGLTLTVTAENSKSSPTPTILNPTPSALNSESAALIQRIPSESIECEIPCWNGLTPGTSQSSQIPAFFSILGIDSSLLPLVDVDPAKGLVGTYSFFRSEPSDTALELIEVTWSDSVEVIQLWFTRYPKLLGEDLFLHPMSFLEHLGAPDETQMYVEQGIRYLVFLNFSKHNMAILYSGFITQDNANDATICITNLEKTGVTISLYSDAIKPFSPVGLDANADYLIEQEMYTGLDSEEFLLTLKDINKCILVEPLG